MLRWIVTTAFLIIALQSCLNDDDHERTAFDPPESVDDEVRDLTKDLLNAVEECDFDRVDAIYRPDRGSVVPTASPAVPPSSIAEQVYNGVALCEYKVELKGVDVGHAVYDPYVDFPDAVAVSVDGEQRYVIDGEKSEWEECLGRYYSSLFEGAWHLVSNWIPCTGGNPSS